MWFWDRQQNLIVLRSCPVVIDDKQRAMINEIVLFRTPSLVITALFIRSSNIIFSNCERACDFP
jgi:hypothetical protein